MRGKFERGVNSERSKLDLARILFPYLPHHSISTPSFPAPHPLPFLVVSPRLLLSTHEYHLMPGNFGIGDFVADFVVFNPLPHAPTKQMYMGNGWISLSGLARRIRQMGKYWR